MTKLVHHFDCKHMHFSLLFFKEIGIAEGISRSPYLNDTTSQPLAAAHLHILEPRKPLPPATTIFFLAAEAAFAPAAAIVTTVLDLGGGTQSWL